MQGLRWSSLLIARDPDAGKDCEQKEKGVAEDELVGEYHSTDMNLCKLWETEETEVLQSSSVQFNSVVRSCLTLCNPMDCRTPGFPVLHHMPEFAQTHVH